MSKKAQPHPEESDEEESSKYPNKGDQIAINCPADPPHPSGWYSAVVNNCTINGDSFTLEVEWDGGDLETLVDPEWRMLGEEPDQKGNTSAKDQRLRPHLSHVVRRLACTDMAESKLPMSTRRQKKAPTELEWVQCASATCGKWRALPAFLNAATLLKSCNNTFFCVLNYWDESLASCAAPQETRLMEVFEGTGRIIEAQIAHGGLSHLSRLQTSKKGSGRGRGREPEPEDEYEYGYRPSNKRRR
ncbi:hypothetical protein TrVE_jg7953 [Triparma verrucosa]|uniref:CW-type domain-containing protein n=2 Tax=Triparma TaxID=722752 RepID=A0A9W7BLS5_9STRA|nr:hypothetical protein TrST_g5184 [Triparma strigata]GMI06640.1 hypothetical protein TrVE_jg7953 [Triparma verrucosa]|mmetsp:Transcript_3096/g.5807  ORF Transcript_3096/g.5807 Transcript_3096/m.5807 type:complete len:245 (+) Transcript_3096:146-880(+)